MIWHNLFKLNKKCAHLQVPVDADYYYCPDCGELIENQWFITRCASCGLKEVATIINGEIIPIESFCHNCGCKNYTVERLKKIDCININYAVLVKEIVNLDIKEYSQSWIESNQTCIRQPKLLKQSQ